MNHIDENSIKRIFFPHVDRKSREVIAAGGRFAYYTTADTATSILRDKQIWMRNTTTMNDYMEVEYGFECLKAAWGEAGSDNSIYRALEATFAGLYEEVTSHFNAWLPGIRQDTYITCLSEHLVEEDKTGRLSMWRAYGGQAGIALVLNGDVMFSESDVLHAYSSPVAYLSRDKFAVEFLEVAKNIEREATYIKSLDREVVKSILFTMLRFAVLCTKHPGFQEEREWRVVASPAMHPSAFLVPSVEVVRGTPQTVLKITLQNHPDQGLVGLVLPELLNRIIIGPCEFPQVIVGAFRQLLIEAGVPNPDTKIIVSDIPLRQL